MLNLLAYAIDVLKPVALWVTVGVVALMIVGSVVFYIVRKEQFPRFLSIAFFAFFVYAVITGVVLLILDIIKHYDAAYLEENWVNKSVVYFVLLPSVITLVFLLIAAVSGFLSRRNDSPALKTATRISAAIGVVAIIATLVLIGIYFGKNISGDGYYTSEGSGFSELALYISSAVMIIIAIAHAFIVDRAKADFNAKMIARAGISIALSFVLSYVSLFKLPQGGTVTLASALPIMLFSYSYGIKRGLIVGLIYGVLQSVQDPFIIHPAQFLLDYPVAFSMLGLAGIFNKLKLPTQVKFTLGAIFAGVFRFSAHVLSGVFAFGAYAEDAGASSHLFYSLAYNSFVFVDIAIVLVAGALLLSSRAFKTLIEAE